MHRPRCLGADGRRPGTTPGRYTTRLAKSACLSREHTLVAIPFLVVISRDAAKVCECAGRGRIVMDSELVIIALRKLQRAMQYINCQGDQMQCKAGCTLVRTQAPRKVEDSGAP